MWMRCCCQFITLSAFLTPLSLFHHGVLPIGCSPSWASITWVLSTGCISCIFYFPKYNRDTTNITDLAQIWEVVCPPGSWLELTVRHGDSPQYLLSGISPAAPHPTKTSNINPTQLTVHYRFRKSSWSAFSMFTLVPQNRDTHTKSHQQSKTSEKHRYFFIIT